MTPFPRHLRSRGRLAMAFVGMLGLVAGASSLGACSMEFKGQPGDFQLSPETLLVLGDDAEARVELDNELTRLFGTQDAPTLAGDGASLLPAAKLYAEKCLHCHGNEGGGDGLTARSLNPVPRDFRFGLFKYNNIADGGRPELADLERVTRAGINGTGMPSMQALPDEGIAQLARYVRFLAMRGEVESWLAEEYEPGKTLSAELADEAFEEVRERWFEAPRKRCIAPPNRPEVTDETIRRGFALFHDPQGANCAGCHGIGGRERGPAAWNTTPISPDEKVALLHDAWGHPSLPRLLDSEIYRHGDDPATLYERLFLGIDGTPMAGLGEARGGDGQRQFSDRDLWSLVHYVRALRDGTRVELIQALERDFREQP